MDMIASMGEADKKLGSIKRKVSKWKEEGYKVDELESKINEVEPSIPSTPKPRYGYVLGVIALFVIIAVFAIGITLPIIDNNDYTDYGIETSDGDGVILGDSDGDGVDDYYDSMPRDSRFHTKTEIDHLTLSVGHQWDYYELTPTPSSDSKGVMVKVSTSGAGIDLELYLDNVYTAESRRIWEYSYDAFVDHELNYIVDLTEKQYSLEVFDKLVVSNPNPNSSFGVYIKIYELI